MHILMCMCACMHVCVSVCACICVCHLIGIWLIRMSVNNHKAFKKHFSSTRNESSIIIYFLIYWLTRFWLSEVDYIIHAVYSLECEHQEYNIISTSTMQDLALSIIIVMYPQVLDIGCYSYTLNNVGSKINTPLLTSLFSHSAEEHLACTEITVVIQQDTLLE